MTDRTKCRVAGARERWRGLAVLAVVWALFATAHASRAQDASAGTSSAKLIQDPSDLRAKLKGIKEPAQLDAFLNEQKLLEPTVGSVPDPELRLEWYAKGCAYDLFQVNLFGSEAKESVLQVRCAQVLYLLAFFERDAKGWRRVPGSVGVTTAPESVCHPARCPGLLCIDFAEVRKKGESSILGRVCESTAGVAGGEVEALYVWQVTAAGPKEVARAMLRQTSRSRNPPTDRQLQYDFEGKFPRKLVLREKLPRDQFGPPIVVPHSFAE